MYESEAHGVELSAVRPESKPGRHQGTLEQGGVVGINSHNL